MSVNRTRNKAGIEDQEMNHSIKDVRSTSGLILPE